jgi:putative CocE/NonD family hydrolase
MFNVVRGPVAILLLLGCTAAKANGQSNTGPGYSIEMSRMIPMRDGVELEAWIFKPSELKGKAPTVLTLTQYEIDGMSPGRYFTQRGYVYIQVYVRGRGRSGGVKTDSLGLQVGRDGYDVVEWIASQPWSDGRVVMYGASFVGMTQWRTAAQNPPHLAGIVPYVSIYPGWDIPNTNGIPQSFTNLILGYTSGRALNVQYANNPEYWSGKMLEHYAAYGSFRDLDTAIGIAPDDWWMTDSQGQKTSMFKVWLDHVGDEAFNLAAEPKPADLAKMKFPVLTATGFYDDDQPGALRYYRRHLANSSPEAARNHYLIIGPWDHLGTHHPVKRIMGINIPDTAVLDMDKLRADWYDWILGRGPKPEILKDRVTYFMMGANEWRYANSLDAASSNKHLTLYLSDPDGTPRDVFHSGELVEQSPVNQPPAMIVSDPRELPELEVAKYAASEDLTSQFRDFHKRVIVFHSDAFPKDVEIAGHMHLKLSVQSDAPDFDLWAQVLMVLPDGSAVRLGEDVRRARFRDGFFQEELLKPGQIAEIPFEFYWMAQRIPAGARLRLAIAPLNSPAYQTNYNTGGRIGYEKIEDARIAHVKLFHDAQHTSVLDLPL